MKLRFSGPSSSGSFRKMSTDVALETIRVAILDLHQAGRVCALVGGIAVSARAEVRFTRPRGGRGE
jgi:hypothetical protein